LSENFENTAHQFTLENGSAANQWVVGTATANGGTKSLYISNNGAGNAYTLNSASIVHAYIDVEIPANGAVLEFDWKARGEGTTTPYDYLTVFIAPTSTTPAASTSTTFTPPAASQALGTFNMSPVDTWNEAEIPIPAGYNDGEWRLIFTWRNDATGGTQPPVAIDNILLYETTAPTPPAIQTLPSGATWIANFEAENHPFTFVSGTQLNYWMVGASTANSGAKSLYVTNNGGGNNYTINTTSVSHAYTNVTIPATGATTLRFNWKARGEATELRDAFIVYLASAAATVPVAGTLIPAGAEPLGTFNMSLVDTWNEAEIPIPAGYNGGAWRLIFTWRNDSSVGEQPPAAIDDIMLVTSTAPTPPAIQTLPAGATWVANFESENPFTFVSGTQANYWMVGASTANSGAKSLYVTNNGGGNAYTITTTNAAAHAYTNVTIPATGATTLRFNWKARGELADLRDAFIVYLASAAATVPAAGTLIPAGAEPLGTFNMSNVDTWNLAEIPIPAGYNNGGEWRLIFTWRNDKTVCVQPPAAIDDIMLVTSTAPTPPAVQTPPAGSTWSANFESENPFTFVNGTQPNYWMWGSSTANSGAKSLYITNNGAGNSYTITSTNAAAHAYVDVTIPEGSNTLQFNWKARGEGTGTNPADTLRVYIAATSTTPAAGTFAPTASEVLGTFNLSPVDTWNLAEIPIPAGYNNGGEWRLIFTWRNDGSVGAQPPIAIDDIALVPAN
jgi:plasmid maintenance system killer protein